MSTIKSSAENLTLNADGANNDIKFQSNGSEVASLDQAGVFTATSFSGGGSTPSIVDGGNATAINIDSSENVGIGHPLSQHQQRLVVKKTAAITSLGGGGGINIVNEQGAGNFANLRFTGSNQNCYLGYRDGANDQDRRFSIGVGADAEHFSFSQAGLKFNGDTAEANGLDDYEAGTWTPTLTCSTSGSYNLDGGANLLAYTKVGRVVHIQGHIGIASESSPNGNLRLSLPFTSFNSTDDTDYSMGNLTIGNHGGNMPSNINLFVPNNIAYGYPWGVNNDGSTFYVNHTHVDTSFQIAVSMTYIAA